MALTTSRAFSRRRREVLIMRKSVRINPAVSFAFNGQTVGLAQSHDHGLFPGTSRRALPSLYSAVASASPSPSAPTCPGLAFTYQAPLNLAGITRRSSRHQRHAAVGTLRASHSGAAYLVR